MKVIVASDNLGKIKEIQSYLEDLFITLIPQKDYHVPSIEETGLSFIENALLKARHAAKYCDLPALADDSGLAVDALGGAPGIYSARYAGPLAKDKDNINKLLQATAHIPEENRQASFYCALVYVRNALDPVPIICLGKWDGTLLREPQGENGFGYDPIFYVPEAKCSAAELSDVQKNTLSHRAKAMKMLITELHQLK